MKLILILLFALGASAQCLDCNNCLNDALLGSFCFPFKPVVQTPHETATCETTDRVCKFKQCFWSLEFSPYDHCFLVSYLKVYDEILGNSTATFKDVYETGYTGLNKIFDKLHLLDKYFEPNKWVRNLLDKEFEYRKHHQDHVTDCWNKA